MYIDTHCHLNFPDYEKDLNAVIKRSINNGVAKIICISSNISDSKKAIEICNRYDGVVFAAVGIHPQKTDPINQDSLEDQINQLSYLASKHIVIAVGECGLDFSPAPEGEEDRKPDEQFFLLRKQIEIAQKTHLPIIIHSRKALDETIGILKRYSNLTGVFHCYSGGKADIEKVLPLGLYFGIDGNITYDVGLQNVVKKIPLEKIILETDSPFLSPVPYRGERNEPKNVKIVAESVAAVKQISLEQVAKTTTENAKRLFKLC